MTRITLLCLLLVPVKATVAADNPLLTRLIEQGPPSSAGAAIKLPAPTMLDDLSTAEQHRRIVQIAEGKYDADVLLRNSVVAPFVLKIETIDPATADVNAACRVDLWFVAYADLARISDDRFLKQQVEAEAKSSANASSPQLFALTDSELSARHISPISDERIFAGNLDLFDRVRLNVALDALQTRTPESVLVAMMLDPRFDSDATLPNGWQKLTRDAANNSQVGPLQAYHAAGGYVKATQLAEPKGALFIEYHLVFEEPREWFDGANLLRSKLPLVCQDGVRKFRRRLLEQ